MTMGRRAPDAGGDGAPDSYLESFDWFTTWLRELRKDGTLRTLARSGEAGLVGQAVAVLEAMDGRPEPVLLSALAAEVTGEPAALECGTTLSALVLRALAARLGEEQPSQAPDRPELWEEFDVFADDLASRVLVLGLPAAGAGLGDWLTGAASRGVPFCATLQQLAAMPVEVSEPAVYVCDSPAVLRAAAGLLGRASRPLICTEGRPSTVFHRLASAVVAGGGELRYHGDFDWPGVAVAASVMARHGAVPWRLSALDYQAARRAAGEVLPLRGAPRPTPWDEELAAAMAQAGQAVREQDVTDALLADLSA